MLTVPTSCIDESSFRSDNQNIEQRLLFPSVFFPSVFYALAMITADDFDYRSDRLDEVIVEEICMLIDSR